MIFVRIEPTSPAYEAAVLTARPEGANEMYFYGEVIHFLP
jgi:hypothetical protein